MSTEAVLDELSEPVGNNSAPRKKQVFGPNGWWRHVGDWLDRYLVPKRPQGARRSEPRAAFIMVLAFVGLMGLQLLRVWPSRPLNSIWEEDGAVFLADSLRWSFLHALTTPYSGYLNTVARLFAAPVSVLPASWFAPALALCGTAVVAASALVVWEASAGHIESAALRATLAAMVVLLPVVGLDSLANVTLSMWFLMFASFWILLWRPATKAGLAVAAVLIFISVLSNGLMLVLLPLWFLRLMAIRRRTDAVIVGSYGLGAALQIAASWGNSATMGEQGGVKWTVVGHWHWSLLPAYLQRVVGSALFGQRVNGFLWVHVGVLLEGLLLVALVAVVVVAVRSRDGRLRIFVPVAVGTSVVMFLLGGFQRQVGSEFLWPHGSYNDDLSHYLIVPSLLLVAVLLVLLNRAFNRSHRWSVAAYLGAACILVVALLNFSVGDVNVRGAPTWTQALAEARASCHVHQLGVVDVTIAPTLNWIGETMMVPCAKVLDVARLPYRPHSDLRTWVNEPPAGSVIAGRVALNVGTSGSVFATTVRFEVTGPSGYRRTIAVSPSAASWAGFGWPGGWDSRSGPNGAYVVQSVVQDASGAVARSVPISVEVTNPGPKSDPRH